MTIETTNNLAIFLIRTFMLPSMRTRLPGPSRRGAAVAAGRAEQLVPDGCELFDRQHRFWAHAKQDSHASLDILEPTNILSRVPSAEASHNTAVDWHRRTCDGSEGF